MNPMDSRPPHTSVLYQEIILSLRPHSSGFYIDATVGAGGHAWGILEASSPNGKLLGLDVDPLALELANQRLSFYSGRYTLVHASYTSLLAQIQALGWKRVDGIVLDLGVSSMQIDIPARGFSFQSEGPLDMRFDPTQGSTAADLVNNLDEQELANIIWRYGDEPQSRRIARAICQARPLDTTRQLAEIISRAFGGHRGKIHPATRTFQALRIAVNQELQSIEEVLPQTIEALVPGGRVAIISFHSHEDRLVKQYFRQESRDCICPPEQPVCTCKHKATIKEVTRHPISPGDEETRENPRARSARLRIAEKLDLA
jgi:16S rRNA (cytosine1402-N4)-methyltransferase